MESWISLQVITQLKISTFSAKQGLRDGKKIMLGENREIKPECEPEREPEREIQREREVWQSLELPPSLPEGGLAVSL